LTIVEDSFAAQRHLVSWAWLQVPALYALRPLQGATGGAPEAVQGAKGGRAMNLSFTIKKASRMV